MMASILGSQEDKNQLGRYYTSVAKKPNGLQVGLSYTLVCLVYPSLCLLLQLITLPSVLKHVLVWTINVMITLVMIITTPHALRQHRYILPKVVDSTRNHLEQLISLLSSSSTQHHIIIMRTRGTVSGSAG